MTRFRLGITLHTLLFLLPLNFYVIGDWMATGIQWAAFRYQTSSMGNSFIPLNRDLSYILTGILRGSSAISTFLWFIGVVLLVIALLLTIFTWINEDPTLLKGSAALIIAGGLLFLLAMFVQYGPFLHGEKGFSIPFGVPLIFFTGWWVYRGFDLEGKEEKMVFQREERKIFGIPQISEPINAQFPEHIPQIDILKALAIISVIILHTVPTAVLLVIGSPYYIWQAVPLFILIAGFNGAYGYRKRNATSIKDCYNPKILFRRYSRLIIPFIIYWVLELILLSFINQVPHDALTLFINFISGGFGWGGYFIPVILQSVIIVPLLYFIAVRNPDYMVGSALFLNVIFAVFVGISGSLSLSEYIYLRYLFAGALGVWLVTSKRRPLTVIIIGGIFSFIYILLASYTTLFPSTSMFYQYNGILQFPTYLWTLILAMIGLKYLPSNVKSRFNQCLAEIGKASWHIFFVQIIYFLYPASIVYIPLNNVLPSFYRDLLMFFGGFTLIPVLTLALVKPISNIIICVSLGYVWFLSGKRLTDVISMRIHSNREFI
jgi:peptidoglycan/LPS O-acetylase OafA/YrhL